MSNASKPSSSVLGGTRPADPGLGFWVMVRVNVKAKLTREIVADCLMLMCIARWVTSSSLDQARARAAPPRPPPHPRRVDVFVSHSWSPPENWRIVMGDEVQYADAGAA